jgi:hypothetical protein
MPVIEHFQCPLHRYTFSVKAIRLWLESVCEGRVLNLFVGQTLLNLDEVCNHLDDLMPVDFHVDTLTFLRNCQGGKFNMILLNPPYAFRKSMKLYKGMGCSPFRQLKDEITRRLQPGGIVMTFGYHYVVMGKARHCELERIALFSHGRAIYDTIATVERYCPII